MRQVCVVAALLVAVGCGGGGGGTAPAPVVTAPTITTASTMIYVGQNVQFSATGGGTIRWGGDAPGVATIDQTSGRATGVGIGRATIWAENAGGRTTRLLRGLPSYAGIWEATYVVTGCQATGGMAAIAFCSNFFTGQVASLGLNASQLEDRVSGQFALGSLLGNLNSSTVAENGLLPLTGSIVSGEVSIDISNARFESPAAGTFIGLFDQAWTVVGASGFGILSCEIRNATRVSGGPTVAARAPADEKLSLKEMIRRVVR
jgi:hypothetical protein